MNWKKVADRWEKRRLLQPGQELESGVTFAIEKWEIPGEEPLEVRVCSRKGVDMRHFSTPTENVKTSIVLHTTSGYGNFSTLMGGEEASAHFMLGWDGNAYLLVPTEWTAWHATWWNPYSVGIEVDTIAALYKVGNDLCSEYRNKQGKHADVYCTLDDKDAYLEVKWAGHASYYATWPEAQYLGCARLVKAICHKHQIPRLVQPVPDRWKAFENPAARRKFKGICTHLNIDPTRREDIGPFIDWDKLIRYGDIAVGDCFSAPGYAPPSVATPKNGSGTGKTRPLAPKAGPTRKSAKGGSVPAEPPAKPGPKKAPASTQEMELLPPPVQVDKNTVRLKVGKRPGRIAFSIQKPGEPVPTAPAPGDLPGPTQAGKRDQFIETALNLQGTPYKAFSTKVADGGLDGPGLICLCLRRVGLLEDSSPTLDGPTIFAKFPFLGGSQEVVPAGIVPGDLAWFGKGDHDNDGQQHPMIYLGGDRVLGPVAGGPQGGAVQVVAIAAVPEKFSGWTHLDDLGTETVHAEPHPGEKPPPGEKLTAALLPSAPADRYDALKALVARLKGNWDDAKGKINLVGVKDLADRCLISHKPDGWNDTLFACFLDDSGSKCSLELRSSLNPATDSSCAGTWQLDEGSWKFKLADGDGTSGKSLQPEGSIKGFLDRDGTGGARGGDLMPPDEVRYEKVDPAQAQEIFRQHEQQEELEKPQATPKAPKRSAGTKVTSSNITVGGKHFADWFNQELRPKYPGNHPTLLLWKKPAPMFPGKIEKANFVTCFDNLEQLWAPEVTLNEFLGFFGIFYNETGGGFVPVAEHGPQKYMFEPSKAGKASYNRGGNRPAGDQLKARGVLSDAGEIGAWNGTVWPEASSSEVKEASKECDYWKYRGHGLIQTTFHDAYLSTVDPHLKAAGHPACDALSTAALETILKTDPRVYLGMVKTFWKNNCTKFHTVNDDPPVWFDTGKRISGQKPYGDLYQWRLETVLKEMTDAGFELR